MSTGEGGGGGGGGRGGPGEAGGAARDGTKTSRQRLKRRRHSLQPAAVKNGTLGSAFDQNDKIGVNDADVKDLAEASLASEANSPIELLDPVI